MLLIKMHGRYSQGGAAGGDEWFSVAQRPIRLEGRGVR